MNSVDTRSKSTKVRIPPLLLSTVARPRKKKHEPWLPSPPSLIEIAGNVVNDLSLPICWNWKVEDVVEWLQDSVKLPDYKDCIVRNHINGRRLLTLDSTVCPSIGIHNFDHLKKITAEVRKLFRVEKEKYNRSVSLPPRYPWTHYLLYRVPTGPTRECTKVTELFLKMGIIDKERICPVNHWDTMNPVQPDFPCNRFGRY